MHQLMYGLVYPAVLGTGMVLTAERITGDGSFSLAFFDPSVQLSIAASLVFAASFVSAFHLQSDVAGKVENLSYNIVALLLDFLEVALMFLCFHFLKLFQAPANPWPNAGMAYLMMVADIPLQYVWELAVGYHIPGFPRPEDLSTSAFAFGIIRANSLKALALVFFLGGFLRGYRGGWINPAITFLILGLLVLFENTNKMKPRKKQPQPQVGATA